jgi:hypothetical protein
MTKMRRGPVLKIWEKTTLCALLLIIGLMITLLQPVESALPLPLPCTKKCGNVTIQYPFGLRKGCGLPGYQLNCGSSGLILTTTSGSYTVTKFDPGYLIVDASTSLRAWTYDGPVEFRVAETSPYVVDQNNVFFGYGANTSAHFHTNNDGGGASPGCQNAAVNEYTTKYCDYYACCQENVPPHVRDFKISATEPDGSSDYGFASVIFPETYKTSAASCFACGTWGFKLSWYVSGTCKKEGKSTCAAAHSICYEDPAGIGTGFRCGCASGYYGDGYKNGTACNSE